MLAGSGKQQTMYTNRNSQKYGHPMVSYADGTVVERLPGKPQHYDNDPVTVPFHVVVSGSASGNLQAFEYMITSELVNIHTVRLNSVRIAAEDGINTDKAIRLEFTGPLAEGMHTYHTIPHGPCSYVISDIANTHTPGLPFAFFKDGLGRYRQGGKGYVRASYVDETLTFPETQEIALVFDVDKSTWA